MFPKFEGKNIKKTIKTGVLGIASTIATMAPMKSFGQDSEEKKAPIAPTYDENWQDNIIKAPQKNFIDFGKEYNSQSQEKSLALLKEKINDEELSLEATRKIIVDTLSEDKDSSSKEVRDSILFRDMVFFSQKIEQLKTLYQKTMSLTPNEYYASLQEDLKRKLVEYEDYRDWLKQDIQSDDYFLKLKNEFGSERKARLEIEKRLKSLEIGVDLVLGEQAREDAIGLYLTKALRKSVQLPTERVGIDVPAHEYEHQATRANKGISHYAKKLYHKSLTPEGLKDKYRSDPTELDARKKALEYEMEKLGIKKIGEPFTREHYKKLLDLKMEFKLSIGTQEFIEIIKPEYFEKIMNTIAEAGEPENFSDIT